MIAWHAATRATPDATGAVAYYGASRLVPLAVSSDATLRSAAVGLVVALAGIPGVGIALNVVAGAAVAVAPAAATSVTPSRRSTAFHADMYSGLPANASAADALALTTGIHNISAAMAATFPGAST